MARTREPKINRIDTSYGRGPYIHSTYKADGELYEFKWAKHTKGLWLMKKGRKELKRMGCKNIELINIDQEVSETKANEIDEFAYGKGPYWYVLIYADPHLMQIILDAEGSMPTAEKAVSYAMLLLLTQGADKKLTNLLKVRKEAK